MKKTSLAVWLPAVLAAAALGFAQPLQAATRTSAIVELTTSIASNPLTNGVIYKLSSDLPFTGGTGQNGLTVAAGHKVVIWVPKGVTLTASGGGGYSGAAGGKGGGNEEGSKAGGIGGAAGAGAGAGICLPSNSSLFIIGGGTIDARGGKNGGGGMGGAGNNGYIVNEANKHTYTKEYAEVEGGFKLYFVSGAGGGGGGGGGGAGAGIGGRGGAGGEGGNGGAGRAKYWDNGPFDELGDSGKNGARGADGDASGTLYVLAGSVKGSPGAVEPSDGSGGECGLWVGVHASNYYSAFGGGGGGGAGAGAAASGIGGGGGGGIGGGGGGGGATRWRAYKSWVVEGLSAGFGGNGIYRNVGHNGKSQNGQNITINGYTGSIGQKNPNSWHGGYGGDVVVGKSHLSSDSEVIDSWNGLTGKSGTTYVYQKASAKVEGAANKETTVPPTDSGVYTAAQFHHNGGTVNGDANPSAWSFPIGVGVDGDDGKVSDVKLPELPTHQSKDYMFEGYFDDTTPKPTQYFDAEGRLVRIWNVPPEMKLTAHWMYCPAKMIVTTESDNPHDSEPNEVSLRDAIAYVKENLGKLKRSGVPPTIKFNSNVENCELKSPLVIEGDVLDEVGELIIDGAHGRGSASKAVCIGDGEGISVTPCSSGKAANLTLRNIWFDYLRPSAKNPHVLTIPTCGKLTVENCQFSNCSGTGALLEVTNLTGSLDVSCCSFVTNRSTGADAGASVIRVLGGSGRVNVLRSTFSGNGMSGASAASVIASAAPTLVANCTFAGNGGAEGGGPALSFGADSAVASAVFSGNGTNAEEIVCGGALRMAYVYARGWRADGGVGETNCVRGVDSLPCVAPLDSRTVEGVSQVRFAAGEDLVGGKIRHDAEYARAEVTIGSDEAGGTFVLRDGSAQDDLLLDTTDQCGETFPKSAVAGAVARSACWDLQTVTLQDANALNRFDGAISLADAFLYSVFYGIEEARAIGFASSVEKVTFSAPIAVTTNAVGVPLRVTVDGAANRTTAVTLSGRLSDKLNSSGLVFGRGVSPVLRNLRFEEFADKSAAGCAVRAEGGDATILNCTFFACGSGPVLSAGAADGLVEIKRCSFTSNIADQVKFGLLDIRGPCRVLSSTFGGNTLLGPLLSLGGADSLLVGLTVADNGSMTNFLSAVAATGPVRLCDVVFHGNKDRQGHATADIGVLPSGSVMARVYATWAESPGLTTFDCVRPEGIAGALPLLTGSRTLDVGGVTHYVYDPALNAIGGFVWHDADWSNVAISRRKNKKVTNPVKGSVDQAVTMYDDDQSGDGGKYGVTTAPTAGAIVAATSDNLRLVTCREDRFTTGERDGLSLREALAEPCVDEDGEPCLVSFSPTLADIVLTNTIVVGDGSFPTGVKIDGYAGRPTTGEAIVIRPSGDAVTDAGAILFGPGNGADMESVVFDGLSSHGRGSALTFDACNTSKVVNCVFRNCTAEGEGGAAVFGRDVVGLLEVARCTFASNAAERGFAALSAAGGGGSCLLASSFTGNSGVGAAVMSNLATVVHCSFADNRCTGPACLSVGPGSNVVVNAVFDRNVAGHDVVAPDDGFATALSHVYGSWAGNCTADDGCEVNQHGGVLLGPARRQVFNGVPHVWHRPAPEMIAARVDYDTNGWATVAVSKDTASPQVLLRGEDSDRLESFEQDLTGTGETLAFYDWQHVPSAGAVICTLANLFCVDRDDDPDPSRCDGRISLREAVGYMAAYGGGTEEASVTFTNDVATIKIVRSIKQKGLVNHPIRIDGYAGRAGGKAAVQIVDVGANCDAFVFEDCDSEVSFANLAFSKFPGGASGRAIVLVQIGAAKVLNCSFTACGTGDTPAVVADIVQGRALEVSRCSVTDGGRFLSTSGKGAVAVLSSTFAGNVATSAQAGGSICCLTNDIVVLGGVTFTENKYFTFCVDAGRSGSAVAVCDALFGPKDTVMVAGLRLNKDAVLASCYGTWYVDGGGDVKTYQCETMKSGESYVAEGPFDRIVSGIQHRWYRADKRAEGYFLWHDTFWENVAFATVSQKSQGARTPLIGNAEFAGEVVSDDEIEDGKYLAVGEPCAGAVVDDLIAVRLVVDTEEDVIDPTGGRISLRSALEFATRFGRNTRNTIRFAPGVAQVSVTGVFAVAAETFGAGIVIDGALGRGSSPAVVLQGGGNVNGFMFGRGNDVTFSNLVMQAFAVTDGKSQVIGSLVHHEGGADLTFANCLVQQCASARTDGSVIYYRSSTPSHMLRVFHSTFNGNQTACVGMVAENGPAYSMGAAILQSDFTSNVSANDLPAVSLVGHANLIGDCLFYKNTGGGFAIDGGGFVCATIAGENLRKGVDASVYFSSETNAVMDRVYMRAYRSDSARLPDERRIECQNGVYPTAYLTTGVNVTVRGVPHFSRRPQMKVDGKPKAPGRFLMSATGLWSADDVRFGDELNVSLPHISVDISGQQIVPGMLPSAGSVFYGKKFVLSPVVTTAEATSESDVTLEEAIGYAMTHAGENTVTFADDLFTPGGTTTFAFKNPITVSNVVGGATLTVLGPSNATALVAYPREINRTRFLYIWENANVRLENLVVSNMQGIVEGVSVPAHKIWETCGGAVLTFGSFEAANCLFTSCEAGSSSNMGQVAPTGDGGAVCAVGKDGKAHFEKCEFRLCKALNGGAIASMDGADLSGADVAADGCTFVTNEAFKSLNYTGYGGAAFKDEHSKLAFSGNCKFIGNISWTNGVPYCDAVEVVRDETGRIVISQLKTGDGTVENGPIPLNSAATLVADSAAVAQSLVPRIAVTGKPWYTATAEGAAVRFVLNEKATPVIGDFDLGAVSSAAGPVSVSVENGKPNLRYALGWSESPAGDFAAHLTEEDWISADAYGRVGPLTAPKGGDGRFYRLLVRPE